MSMIRTGKSKEPVGGDQTPYPNGAKVLVYKGEQKGFLAQPTLTDVDCPMKCPGKILVHADGKRQCQVCLHVA